MFLNELEEWRKSCYWQTCYNSFFRILARKYQSMMVLTSQIEDRIDEPSQGDLFIENQDTNGAYVNRHPFNAGLLLIVKLIVNWHSICSFPLCGQYFLYFFNILFVMLTIFFYLWKC